MLMRRIRSDIESDGHCMRASKDPPGQRCVYIIPGNPDNEIYRLTTFKKYPTHVPVDYMDLAAAGFYYTGYKDRVKCFGCGKTVEDWTLTDNPKSNDWHLTGCEMVTGTVERNIPLGCKIKANSSPVHTRRLSTRQNGGVNLVLPSNAVNTTQSSASINNTQESYQNQFSQQLPTNLQTMFPCHNPANPHMGITESREQTFLDNNNWPGYRIRATPHQIAEAGMFYLGNRDRVKCWYCNGGLQNWETSDDPWFEHAKWFPECEFLLQSKGPEFVKKMFATSLTLTSALLIIDPQKEIKDRKERAKHAMRNFPFLDDAKMMGYLINEIKQAFYRQFELTNTTFSNCLALVESLLAQTKKNSKNQSVSMQTISSSLFSASPPTQSAPTSTLEELRSLEKLRSCKSCRIRVANVVFISCGHLVLCFMCLPMFKKCPVCEIRIKGIIIVKRSSISH